MCTSGLAKSFALSLPKFCTSVSHLLKCAEFTLSIAKNVALFETVRILRTVKWRGWQGIEAAKHTIEFPAAPFFFLVEKIEKMNQINESRPSGDTTFEQQMDLRMFSRLLTTRSTPNFYPLSPDDNSRATRLNENCWLCQHVSEAWHFQWSPISSVLNVKHRSVRPSQSRIWFLPRMMTLLLLMILLTVARPFRLEGMTRVRHLLSRLLHTQIRFSMQFQHVSAWRETTELHAAQSKQRMLLP